VVTRLVCAVVIRLVCDVVIRLVCGVGAVWLYDLCLGGYKTAVRCGYTTAVRCGHRSLFSVVRCGMVATLALLLPDVARVDSPFLCPDMDMQLCRTMSARCHVR